MNRGYGNKKTTSKWGTDSIHLVQIFFCAFLILRFLCYKNVWKQIKFNRLKFSFEIPSIIFLRHNIVTRELNGWFKSGFHFCSLATLSDLNNTCIKKFDVADWFRDIFWTKTRLWNCLKYGFLKSSVFTSEIIFFWTNKKRFLHFFNEQKVAMLLISWMEKYSTY